MLKDLGSAHEQWCDAFQKIYITNKLEEIYMYNEMYIEFFLYSNLFSLLFFFLRKCHPHGKTMSFVLRK